MKAKYTTILYDEKKEMGVTLSEYVLLDIIFHLENNTRFDGCRVKVDYFAECLDLSERQVKRYLSGLEQKGWLVSNGTGHRGMTASRKTTEKYKDIRQKIKGDINDTLKKERVTEVVRKGDISVTPTMISTGNNSITEGKNSTVANAPVPSIKEEYNSKSYLEEMSNSKDKRMKIIAWYINKKEIDISSYAKALKVIKRNLKVAGELIPYGGAEVGKAYNKCLDSSKGEYDVTLETILKKLTNTRV